MAELDLDLKVKAVLCDFELNIFHPSHLVSFIYFGFSSEIYLVSEWLQDHLAIMKHSIRQNIYH